jgi:cell division protein FtsI (penicillin-binding protein 3)
VVPLVPARGDILDRNGELLAYSVDGQALVADPKAMEADKKALFADQICRALSSCTPDKRAAMLKSLSRPKSRFAWLERPISAADAGRVEQLKIPGVWIQPQPRRFYPKLDLASHVVGFVDIDSKGLGGIERAYDSVIHGSEGKLLFQVDARQKRMDSRVQQPPTAGATVELTLDLYLQHIAERELKDGVEASHASGGTAIVMNPWNGEILALASYPTFNPNAVQQFSDDEKRNRAIQEIYEPGSTFKIVTVSAALEDGVFTVNDLIDTNPGRITFGSRVIDEDKGHNYGVLPFGDVIVRSSNVGATKIGLRVGAERMGRFVQGFGFGQRLLPDLRAGQSGGIVWKASDLDDSALASVAMGYQIGVTPLQMATATSVVANGGLLYEPHLVRAIIRGDHREPIAPKVLRRVISSETAATLTTMMEGVVERGTATRAKMDDFQVAGKTGTASKLVHGQYSHSDYNVSFIGFVPSRRPALTILVVVDTPRNGSPYGGIVAAPIFKRIADAALRQLAVTPTINPPPVIIASARSAELQAQTISAPAARPLMVPAGGEAIMPDVRGLSARDAVRVLNGAGLQVRVTGVGVVASQSPDPGEPIETGSWGTLELRRAGDPRITGGRQ